MFGLTMYLWSIPILAIIFGSLYISFVLRSPKHKGKVGEGYARRILKRLPRREYRVMNNVVIRRADGTTTQIDHILICRGGIAVIESKNYAGLIAGSLNDEWWFHGYHSFKNPLRQNYGHVKALQEILNVEPETFVSIVVFSNYACLNIDPNVPPNSIKEYVTHFRALKQLLLSLSSKPQLSSSKMDELHEAILAANIRSRRVEQEHVQRLQNYVRNH